MKTNKKRNSVLCFFVFFSILLFNVHVFSAVSSNTESVQEGEIFFTILHTNDEHSSLIPHSPAVDNHPELENPSIGGYARLATQIKQIRKEKAVLAEPVLLVSAGDFMGGTAFSWLIPEGLAVELAIKQFLGYDAVTVGNHEYDYGTDVLTRYLEQAGYPKAHELTAVLAANTLVDEEHPIMQKGLFKKYHIITMNNGLKVGFFGIIGKDAISVASDPKPFTFEEQEEAARAAVQALRKQGVDLVIAISHSGEDEDSILAEAVSGIDVIIGGHSHTALVEPITVGNTIIVQAGAYLKYLGRLELAYQPVTGELRVRNEEKGHTFLIPLDSSVPQDPDLVAMIEDFTQTLNQLVTRLTNGQFKDILETVAFSGFPLLNTPPLNESAFGNFVADAMRFTAWTMTGRRVDVAIQANGSIRGSLLPGTMDHSRGRISFYDMTALISLGYGDDGNAGYPLVSFYLTGEEIRRALEVAVLMPELMGDDYFLQFSGLRYQYNPKDAVLFTIPFIETPLPSTRAVKGAELYMADGIQSMDNQGYVKLNRGDDKLYHIVTDSYILSFLPLAGKLLPQLTILPKDLLGNPVALENFNQFILEQNGYELKVWQAVVEYAAASPVNANGFPQISGIYASTSERINPTRTIPLVIWLVICAFAVILMIAILIRYVRTRRWLKKEAKIKL